MRLLIVNADDFGLADAANEGIIQSFLAGTVTSTTLMVNAPATERAAALALQHPGLGVGLHFNLTWGRPISPPESVSVLLGSDGCFLPREALARKLLTGRVPAQQLELELSAQLRRLRELGVDATHIDSHQHVHGFGTVFDVVAHCCAQAKIPMRVPWVASIRNGSPMRKMRRALLAWLLARATRRWRGQVAWNESLGSVFDLEMVGDPIVDDDYRRLLQRATGVSFELMVHPVTSGAAMEGYTRIGPIGEAEWRYLRQGNLASLAREAGFRLGSYRDLGEAAFR